jgi:hypothetical protein
LFLVRKLSEKELKAHDKFEKRKRRGKREERKRTVSK